MICQVSGCQRAGTDEVTFGIKETKLKGTAQVCGNHYNRHYGELPCIHYVREGNQMTFIEIFFASKDAEPTLPYAKQILEEESHNKC